MGFDTFRITFLFGCVIYFDNDLRTEGGAGGARFQAAPPIEGSPMFSSALLLALAGSPAASTTAAPPPPQVSPSQVGEVIVTASRRDLLGKAITASQGSVTQEEI